MCRSIKTLFNFEPPATDDEVRAASETSVTARLKAASLDCDGLLKPDNLRTNCSAEARISSSVAGGSKLNSVLILRHMSVSLARSSGAALSKTIGCCKIRHRGLFWHPHRPTAQRGSG